MLNNINKLGSNIIYVNIWSRKPQRTNKGVALEFIINPNCGVEMQLD